MNYLLAMVVLVLAGCSRGEPELAMKSIRSCEYIIVRDRNGISIVHAGDCQGPVHNPAAVSATQMQKESGLRPVMTWENIPRTKPSATR